MEGAVTGLTEYKLGKFCQTCGCRKVMTADVEFMSVIKAQLTLNILQC